MALIPKEHEAKAKLDAEGDPEYPRPYLGMSMIGNPCPRYLQYYWRWAFRIRVSGRLRRLFDAGHDAEARIVDQLGGVTHTQRKLIGFAKHWRGHIDGIWKGKLLEIKTFNSTRFTALVKKGVQDSNPGHYAQMQAYMDHADMPKRATYIATNKNDSSLYVEDVRFDEDYAAMLSNKAVDVVMSQRLLPKIGTGEPTWIDCKYCDARNVCHYGAMIERNCRTCVHVVAIDDGKWTCGHTREELTTLDQEMGCNQYSLDREYFDVQTVPAEGY